MSRDVQRRTGPAWWVLVGLTVVVTSESIRVAFPLLYDVREDTGAGVAVAWALGAFVLVPSLSPIARRIAGPDLALKLAATALAATRLAMQLADPIPLWLAAVAVAAGVIALVLELHVSRARAEGAGAALAFAVGLSVDAAIRGAYETWDPLWQDGLAPTTLAAFLAGTLAAAVWTSGALPGTADREPRSAWSLTLIGPFLLLQTLFLQNAAFVASEYGHSLPAAVLTILAADVIAVMLALAVARHPGRVASLGLRIAVAVVSVVVVAGVALTDVRGLVPIGHISTIVLLLWAVDRPVTDRDPATSWRTTAASVLGTALFVGGAFAYQIDIDVPLPLPRATFPLVAGLLLGLAAIPRPDRDPCPAPRRLWLVPAGLLLAVGLAFALHDTGTTALPVLAADPLTVMSWNIHTAVDADGNVDLASIAEEIERRAPDAVLLQEVGRGWPIAGQVDQAGWLARRLRMDVIWVSAADDQFGNAILTRLPVLGVDLLRLPYGEGPQYRSALRVLVDTGAGWTTWLVDAHLQDGDKASTREDQISAILDAWGDEPPIVIGGDLNMQPSEDNVALFTDAGLVSAQDAAGDPDASTARDPDFPGDRVDWIWIDPSLAPSGFEIGAIRVSDHLPLEVRVTPVSG